jgi:hypothetical protein
METQKAKNTAKKAVNFLSAIISALKDPAVKECIDASLKHQKEVAARRSLAGRADQVLAVVSDPRTILATEAVLRVANKQLSKRRR